MQEIWANIFLGCFLFGFVFAAISLIFGMGSGHGFHFGGHDGFHFGGDHGGGAHIGHSGGVGHGHAGGADTGSGGGQGYQVPFLSFNGILMFITWFGGVGYILNSRASAPLLLTLLGALAAGVIGAAIVFYFLNKFLLVGQTRMDPVDYYMPGTMARITSPIREGGVGEIMYVQGGTRKTAGARSEENLAHAQGEEVVVVRYDKGIAYVKSVEHEFE
jgi:hypothetical protein